MGMGINGGGGNNYGGQVDRMGRWTGKTADPRTPQRRPEPPRLGGNHGAPMHLPPRPRPAPQLPRVQTRPVDTITNTHPNRNVPPGVGILLPPSSLPGAVGSFLHGAWETLRPRRR